ncbi:MAG: hypothetical protein H5T34_06465 [Candidatus Methanomethyliales bacterium]|nr:hypothetical protein [Candidatus Methanomethylicales archaeon]
MIALLVAIVASTNAVTNYLNFHAEALAGLVNPTETYIILSGNFTALTDSQIGMSITDKLVNISYVKHVLPQKIVTANLTTSSGSLKAQVRGVNDVNAFLLSRRAYINGTTAKNRTEANVGEILARTYSISLGDVVDLAVGNRRLKVKMVGVFRSQTQSDIELIVPMETANILAGDNDTITFIEFAIKEG